MNMKCQPVCSIYGKSCISNIHFNVLHTQLYCLDIKIDCATVFNIYEMCCDCLLQLFKAIYCSLFISIEWGISRDIGLKSEIGNIVIVDWEINVVKKKPYWHLIMNMGNFGWLIKCSRNRLKVLESYHTLWPF